MSGLDVPRYELWDFDDPSLAGRLPSDWTAREANRNAQRLASLVPDRVEYLLSYLQLKGSQRGESLLGQVDERLSTEFSLQEFGAWSGEGEARHPTLTPAGMCLCVDAGLLVCSMLMDEFEALVIVARTKTSRSDAYRNQAELTAVDWDYWQRFSIVWMSGVEGASFIRQGLHPNRGFKVVYNRLASHARQSQQRHAR